VVDVVVEEEVEVVVVVVVTVTRSPNKDAGLGHHLKKK
jgi:hypothetical protein